MSNPIQWLHNELPKLVADGIVDGDTAERLRKHYGAPEETAGSRLILVAFALLGAALVGSGMILLLAHNWETFSRPLRVALAVVPLAVVQTLGVWAMATDRSSLAWRESLGLLQALLIGSSIALIGQTYHIPGDLGQFLLVWMLLVLPIAYLMRAIAPAILYLGGILMWAVYETAHPGGTLIWLLFAAILPLIVFFTRRHPQSLRAAWFGWATAIWLAIAVGRSLEHSPAGLWFVVYGALFAAMALIGARPRDRSRDRSSRFWWPFALLGNLGVFGLSYALTFETAWNDLDWRSYRIVDRFHDWAVGVGYVLTMALLVAALLLWVERARQQRDRLAAYGALPVLAAVGLITTVSGWMSPLAAAWCFNAYLLALGVITMSSGLRKASIGRFNLGLLAVAALILTRFFDSELGLLVRGIVFILVGVGFLLANLSMARRAKEMSS